MRGTRTERVRATRGLVLGALLTAGLLACAASTLRTGDTDAPEVIEDVRVGREAGNTLVTLVGLRDPVVTAFAQSAPERVVVDLASVEPDGVMDDVAVYDGLVDDVTISPFSTGTGDSITRVEIGLATAADFEIEPGEEGLVIRVIPFGAAKASETAALPQPGEAQTTEEPWARAAETDDDLLAQAPAATTLLGVEVEPVEGGALIRLQADGVLATAIAFTLEEPERLVLDLPGLVNAVEASQIDAGLPHAARLRIGQHQDMVRVVVDAGAAKSAFGSRRVVPAVDGLVVALGAGSQVASVARRAAPREADAIGPDGERDSIAGAEIAASPRDPETGEALEGASPRALDEDLARLDAKEVREALVEIQQVEFDAQLERDRVVIQGARPVDYLVYEPDAETMVLSIQNAVLDPDAAVRLAPEAGGPVSLVTSFEQPEVETEEVRVVVKHTAGLAPEISRRGSTLVVDFERPEGLARVAPHAGDAVPAELADATDMAELAELADLSEASQPAAMTEAAEMSAPAAIAPPETQDLEVVPASLEPPASISLLNEGGLMDGKQYSGRRISLDFKDVDIADVLRLIAEVSDLNVIAGDEVSGRVTIRLVDVPWDQALDVVLLTKGLGFVRVGNVLRIAPVGILKQEEELRLQERRNLEKLEDLVVKLQPVNYADTGAVSGMVKKLLSARGSVDVDSRTSTIIIKDIPSVIDEATALIKAIDTQTPQVMIEAKIVEASLDFSREFGTVWGFGTQPLVDGFDSSSGARQDLGGQDFRLHDANNISVGNPITAGPTGAVQLAMFIWDEKLNLDLTLQAAEVNGDGKVISSPRIVTLDNSAARIQQGVSIPFQTFENGDAGLEFVDAVLQLKVTPHITADRAIIMDIAVSRNAPDDSVFTLTGSPAIAKNQVETNTLVKDGQTLVLGGIYVVDKSQRQSRVPYLHRMPILGNLFRSDEISDARKELLIFVTPQIVENLPLAS